ncbi:cellulase family glycosylhydrolase [Cellulomonas sp. KRMCY2]|uniref:glycoside hydrolase 5 family protein n=1 Tax=Cellulomonas sp. KRMCY2 TaxID=1304865 RepID=UPI00045E8D1E|nr:cellulase family glycosylhydrolase [Cellulomonas sp. KRMCY2]
MKRSNPKVVVDGEPQTWIGVNFWSRVGGPLMWRGYDAETVESELRVMRDHGMTLTRSFFYWPDFMPTPDALDETLVEHFRDFLDRHHALGMTTIPTFLVGHMSGENWDPVWRGGRDLFADVWFVARQAWYVRELTARFADHPAVVGWLLTNEIPIYDDWRKRGVGSDRTQRASEIVSWAQILIDAVRAGGGTQPVSVGEGAWGVEVTGQDNGFRIRDLSPLVDFLGPHVYRMESDVVRQHLGAAFVCELLDIDGQPVVMEEFGLTSDYASEENAAHYYRQVLHNTLLAGATGWIAWNNTDYDDLWDQAPYSHHPFEMHFGLTDAAGNPKAQAREVKAFAQVVAEVDLAHCHRPDSRIALVVSSYLEAQFPFTYPQDAAAVFDNTRQAYVAAREADLPVGVAREADGLPDDCALYIVPSVKALTAPTWRHLLELAEGGATVYCSSFVGAHGTQRGSWWPSLDETFGVIKKTRYGIVDPIVEDELRVTMTADLGTLRAGAELVFAVGGTEHSRSFLPVEAREAQVLAVDPHGNPVLLRRRVGTGSMILCTYPLEHMAAVTPGVNPEPTWRLYDALAADAGVRPDVRVADPRVLVGQIHHQDGRRFVWFVSQSDGQLEVAPEVDTGHLVGDDGPVPVLTLAPYGVTVLRLEA